MRQMTTPAQRSATHVDTAADSRRRVVAAAMYGLRYVLVIGYVLAAGYICVLAFDPGLRNHAPKWLRWFGAPESYESILVVLAFPAGLFLLARLSGRRGMAGTSVLVVAGLAASAVALGMSAYSPCVANQSPFFAPLTWTLGLFVSAVENPFARDAAQIASNRAPGVSACALRTMPLALEMARLFAIATTLTTALAAALTVLRSQSDRFAIWRAHSLTVVVGIDDDAVSMIEAIASRMASNARLVLVTSYADRPAVHIARELGAKVQVTPLQQPGSLSRLRLWKRLDRLYLLSADPGLNQSRLNEIDTAMENLGVDRIRLPLTMRIDDPWQAEVWRRRFLAKDVRWTGDAIGPYEVTAVKLVRHLVHAIEDGNGEPPDTVLLCGLHPLIFALSSELAQVQREQKLFRQPYVHVPSTVKIVAGEAAKSFVDDHELRQNRLAPDAPALSLVDLEAEPTVGKIAELFGADGADRVAVILVDPSMETAGTRLASRFADLRIYPASATASALMDSPIVGQLFPFPINMDLDPQAPHDVWERAAELIHELYSQTADRQQPSARPWRELDRFFKESNRRQVVNTLWMVEKEANHSWDTLEKQAPSLPENFDDMEPLDQLHALGFDGDIPDKLVRLEHEDWRRFYSEAGWKYGDKNSYERRRHPRLKPWDELIDEDPESKQYAYHSLVSALLTLRALGYRSLPRSTEDAGTVPSDT